VIEILAYTKELTSVVYKVTNSPETDIYVNVRSGDVKWCRAR